MAEMERIPCRAARARARSQVRFHRHDRAVERAVLHLPDEAPGPILAPHQRQLRDTARGSAGVRSGRQVRADRRDDAEPQRPEERVSVQMARQLAQIDRAR